MVITGRLFGGQTPHFVNLTTYHVLGRSMAHVRYRGMALAGALCFGFALAHWQRMDPTKLFCYLIAALLGIVVR